jgi:4a-hydroxytetrahydrobiopterin dehydratase
MERRKLSHAEIHERLAKLPGWQVKDEKLYKRFEFQNFENALAFVNRIGAIAERRDHHPDITFGWGYVEVYTVTHDRDGITDHDFALAHDIDAD